MQELIEKGQKFLMNTYGRLPIVLDKGKGNTVQDVQGKEYLDFLGGIAVNTLGHCNELMVSEIARQSKKIIHCSNYYWTKEQIDLAELLVENSCGDKAFFANSGAEANEGAIKLARIWAQKNFNKEKNKILTLNGSFHGRTLATLTATGQESFHQYFSPLLQGIDYVDADLQEIAKKVDETVCGILVEPVQGEGGINILPKEFMQGLEKLCKERNVLLICDEVQTGIGRTGKFFAYEHSGISPDIITCAKALGGGLPIGAFLAKDNVASAFVPGDHGSTFGGNPFVCGVAQAIVKTVCQKDFLQNVREMGEYFQEKIAEINNDKVKEIRGLGLMIGVELTEPKAKEIMKKAATQGMLFCTCGDRTLRFLPALNVSKEEVDKAVGILGKIL